MKKLYIPLVIYASIEEDQQEAERPHEADEEGLEADEVVDPLGCGVGKLAPAYGLAGVVDAEVAPTVVEGEGDGQHAHNEPAGDVDE